ncbi:predicted protein [Naegleria gruberi]|uniref:Predicted protein n=1 Tax=Naegleria gruberi TaxID=5762 RepID=D2W0D1_NAEGR|nr:uncharacterized protein NAEGRDRAFT_74817 [Naegleria gruberi]EFC37454.1 predicted protein [Naegleria gruberi]|eukprot:XP_002670198.1 predicted protein [Naegleria gruberi strain NEG-M]
MSTNLITNLGCVVVQLVDFVTSDRMYLLDHVSKIDDSEQDLEHTRPLFRFLQSKMRKYAKYVGFDYQRFDANVGKLNGDNMSYPLDVKISTDYQCILVCDQLKNRIVVFDYNTLKQKKVIDWHSDSVRPRYMAIEIIDSRELYLYFTNTKFGVVKCKLSTLLCDSKDKFAVPDIKEWTRKVTDPQGLTIKYRPYNQNLILVCEKTEKQIQFLDSNTGSVLRSISLASDLLGPWSISFNSLGDLIIGDCDKRKIFVLRQDGDSYTVVNSFGTFKDIYGLSIDYSNDYIYASDFANAIQVFTPTGELVKKITHGSIINPIGIHIDNKGGRLLFSDYSSMHLVCLASPGSFDTTNQ